MKLKSLHFDFERMIARHDTATLQHPAKNNTATRHNTTAARGAPRFEKSTFRKICTRHVTSFVVGTVPLHRVRFITV